MAAKSVAVYADSDGEDSDSYTVDKVTSETARDPNRPQRVIVAFNAYDKDGESYYCPNRVITLDNACQGRSNDASVICRMPADGKAKEKRLKRIKWVARAPAVEGLDPPQFTVRFAKGLDPCADSKEMLKAGGGSPASGWSGSRVPRNKQVCVLKNSEALAVVQGRDAQFKYDIVMAKPNKRCGDAAVLDPYFIVWK